MKEPTTGTRTKIPSSLPYPTHPSDIILIPDQTPIDKQKLFNNEVTFGKSGNTRYDVHKQDFYVKNDLTIKTKVYQQIYRPQLIYQEVRHVEVDRFIKPDKAQLEINDMKSLQLLLGENKDFLDREVLYELSDEKDAMRLTEAYWLTHPKFGEKLVVTKDDSKTNLLYVSGELRDKLLWSVDYSCIPDSDTTAKPLDFTRQLYRFQTPINQLKLNSNKDLAIRFYSGISVCQLNLTSKQSFGINSLQQLKLEKSPLDLEFNYLNKRNCAVVDEAGGVYLWDYSNSSTAEKVHFTKANNGEPIVSKVDFGYHPRSLLVADHRRMYLLDARSPNNKVLSMTPNLEDNYIFGFKVNPNDRFKVIASQSTSLAVHDLRLAHPITAPGNSTILEYKFMLSTTPKPHITFHYDPSRLGIQTVTLWGPNQNLTFFHLDSGVSSNQPSYPKLLGQPSQLDLPLHEQFVNLGTGNLDLPSSNSLFMRNNFTAPKRNYKVGYLTPEVAYHPQIEGLATLPLDHRTEHLQLYYLLEDGSLLRHQIRANYDLPKNGPVPAQSPNLAPETQGELEIHNSVQNVTPASLLKLISRSDSIKSELDRQEPNSFLSIDKNERTSETKRVDVTEIDSQVKGNIFVSESQFSELGKNNSELIKNETIQFNFSFEPFRCKKLDLKQSANLTRAVTEFLPNIDPYGDRPNEKTELTDRLVAELQASTSGPSNTLQIEFEPYPPVKDLELVEQILQGWDPYTLTKVEVDPTHLKLESNLESTQLEFPSQDLPKILPQIYAHTQPVLPTTYKHELPTTAIKSIPTHRVISASQPLPTKPKRKAGF